ncbi:hypothetical protein [Pontibacter saemangeumensis]
MHTRLARHQTALSLTLFPLLLLLLSYGCASKGFYAQTPVTDQTLYKQLSQAPDTVDSVTVQAGSHYARGFLYRMFWGSRHRDAWAASITVPVLDFDSAKGGLEVEKLGGGMQTISASLVSGDGMTYALRTVDKRPEVRLPPILSSTFLANLVLDQTSSLHPYAPLVVAPLSEAAGVPHANPELVYVRPNEEALGEHKALLSDRLYMLEEKFNDRRALVGELEEALDIVGTKEMLARRYGHGNHHIDQLAFAKARLLDMLIGDRDRHEGQWEWAVYKQGGDYIYRPIPKDRDNAFFRFDDGLFSWLLSRRWAQRKFVTFHGDYRDVKALMIKSDYIDARALPEVTAQQFDSLARELQRGITDELIEEAVRQLPAAVYRLDGESLARKLKSRRDFLDGAARAFYEALAGKVLVLGTNEEDRFEVVRLTDEETEVTVRRKSDGKVTYRRVFLRSQTEKIALQGLSGDDLFEVRGHVRKGIHISLVGGDGQDEVKDTS